jgi:sec-independent protein translocase protein TatA
MLSLFAWVLPGHMELLVVAGVALLLFGHRLPSVMRSLGSGIVEFKKGMSGVDDDPEKIKSEEKPST